MFTSKVFYKPRILSIHLYSLCFPRIPIVEVLFPRKLDAGSAIVTKCFIFCSQHFNYKYKIHTNTTRHYFKPYKDVVLPCVVSVLLMYSIANFCSLESI